MLPRMVKRFTTFIVSLRFSILSIFITFFVVTIILLMSLAYIRTSNVLIFTADKLMQKTAAAAINELDAELLDAEDEARFVAQLIGKNILDVNNKQLFVPYLFSLIKRYPLIQSAFWGDEKGNFVTTERELDGKLTLRVVDRHVTPAMKRVTVYQKEYRQEVLQDVTSADLRYDHRQRVWYQMAKKKGKLIWTDVYTYPSHLLGITVAVPVYDQNHVFRGVFAFDVRLDFLSHFIAKETAGVNGMAFVSTLKGGVIAFPEIKKYNRQDSLLDIHLLNPPWLVKSFDIYQKTAQHDFSFHYGSETYLANYNHIPHFSELGWIMGIVVPENDFIFELKKAVAIDLGLGLLILIFGVIFVSSVISRVVRPIKRVVNQIDKIKQFDLSGQRVIESRIEEVILLSKAVQALRSGLRAFQKYVPATLVRQLIETGQGAAVGGAKKDLTVFFSDIENFTALAENMDPNLLMEYLCEYFDALSKIITAEEGTIDKYIGDSIMAFWGAPIVTPDPCHRAARSALNCMRCLEMLNKKWEAEGRQRLLTRIGLHRGDAVVGNVGSAERINYTALGDAINVASRLEGLNKIYFTKIMVSEVIYQNIKDHFVLRLVDSVVVKGKAVSGNVYELLAETKAELSFDIDSYREMFMQGFALYQRAEWDAAKALFEKCLLIYPADSVAPIFIRRCDELKAHPREQWDGVWRWNG